MNCYDEVLGQVLDVMLDQKDCHAESQLVQDKLVFLMRYRLRDIAVTTSNAASHAGRSAPCYFDVERTFRVLGIQVRGLRELRNTKAEFQPAAISFHAAETRDEDIHQRPQLDINQQRGARSGRHIPKYMPPFPGLHTYKNTMMDIVTDRGYISERERRAQLHQSAQRALNKFYLRTLPTTSLFIEPQHDTEFMVLNLKVPKKPAYLAALMPRNEVFDVDIYEFNHQPNEQALNNPFMKQPKEYYDHSRDQSEYEYEEIEKDQQNEQENRQEMQQDIQQENQQEIGNEREIKNENEDMKVEEEENEHFWELPNLNADD